MSLVGSNVRRVLQSASKMLKAALAAPLSSRTPLLQAFRTLSPLLNQLMLSGYVFAMQLPPTLVIYFLTGGNYYLMTGIHKGSHGRGEFTPSDEGTSMASSMGPSLAESKTQTASGESYPATIKYTHDFANIMNMAGYYRDGASVAKWRKSIETVANLHSVAGGSKIRRSNSGAGLLDEGTPGALQASSTVFWGKEDIALNPQICLDGMADYLVADSQVVMLTESGHFTPIEQESRVALIKAVEWAIHGEKGDIGAAIQECYPSAKVVARR